MNYVKQLMQNPKDISDPIIAMNMTLVLIAKAFKLNYTTATKNNQKQTNCTIRYEYGSRKTDANGIQNVGNKNGLIVVPTVGNQNGNVVVAMAENNGIQIQAEKFDLMAVAIDCEEVEEVNANCNLMANLQQASTSCTYANKISIYDSNVIARATPCLRWSMWWTSEVRDKEGHIQCPPCICYIHGLGHEP
ncbi:hypothetical protein Tco_0975740 [Tanacetum coccineum]|uniref:Uncharacterized protein n=1 Tax=Tanacetum coccineum TaxID=301880 RepID=A0ABQ5EFJ1_9ASTR